MRKIISFIKDIGKVKKVKRAGWVREGITNPESVADHSFRVTVMAMVFGKKLGVNTNRLIKMALIHDIAEGVLGDKIVERGNKIDSRTRDKKNQEETKTLKRIFANLQDSREIIRLQQEITEEATQEAKILKQLERLEMAVQAMEYEEEFGKNLSEFFKNASFHINHPYLKKLLNTVKNTRPKRHSTTAGYEAEK